MNIRVISRNVGIAMVVEAAFMLASAAVSALNGYDSSFSPLLLSGMLTLAVGVFPLVFVRRNMEITIKEGLATAFFAWFLCCLFGMFPFVLWGGEFTLINAWFESVSGITTTGATILEDIEALPKGLLFWRSASHFIGGLGVVVFMMVILPTVGGSRLRMSKMEVSDVSKDYYNVKTYQLTNILMGVYGAIFLLSAVTFILVGMRPFDAVNHAMTVAATGGFSTKNASLGAFDSVPIELTAEFYMIVASLHFGLIYISFSNRNLKVLKNPVTKFYLLSLAVCSVLIIADLLISGTYTNVGEAIRQGVFNVVSLGTSTGLTTCDTAKWPLFSIIVLLYISIQCGCSGSTTGGVKADRIWIAAKAMRAQMIKAIHPNAVVPIKFGKGNADRDLVDSVIFYLISFVVVMFTFALIYSAFGLDVKDAFSGSVSMLANIGPAFGSIGALDNYAHMPETVKVLMGIEMIIGRIGVFTSLLFVTLLRKDN